MAPKRIIVVRMNVEESGPTEDEIRDLVRGWLYGILAVSATLVGGGIVCYRLLVRYIRYMLAKRTMEESEEMIQKIRRSFLPNIRGPPSEPQIRYRLQHLTEWEEKRRRAAAYMEKHKWIGKLVF